MNLRFTFFLWLAVPALFRAEENLSLRQHILPLTPPTLSKEATPRPEEDAKIHQKFLAQDPWIKVFARFPFFYSTIYFEDRKTMRVRFDICSAVDDDKYVVWTFLSMRVDSSLSKVLEHKITIEAQYFPVGSTNVDRVGPLIRISEKDLERFCEAPVEYLRKNVPTAKKEANQPPEPTPPSGRPWLILNVRQKRFL